MKRRCPLTLLLLFLTLAAAAQDYRSPPKLQVSLQPTLGYRGGSIGEHLFNMNGTGMPVDFAPSGGRQISYLQWDIYGMMTVGLEAGFRYKSFSAQITGEIGIPMACGKMDDYDWNSTRGHQTHFSTHKNKLTDHFSLGGLLGWEFSSVDRRLQIIPMAGFSWQRTSMLAVDGYRQYVLPGTLQETTPWTPDLPKKYFDGDIISYRHEVFQVDCVLRIRYNHSLRLTVDIDGSVHPIVGAFGYDTHILRNEQFLDNNMRGQVAFGAALTVSFQVLPKNFLTVKIHGTSMPVVVGQTYMKSVSETYYYPDYGSRGGASHWFAGVTVGWKFNLFQ